MSGSTSPTPQSRASLLAGFIRQVRLCWQLLRHPAVPAWIKTVPILAVLYVLLPIDLLPDPLLGLGQLDDLAIIVLGMELLVNLSPPAIVAALRHEIEFGRRPSGAASPAERDVRTVEGDYRVLDDTGAQDSRRGR